MSVALRSDDCAGEPAAWLVPVLPAGVKVGRRGIVGKDCAYPGDAAEPHTISVQAKLASQRIGCARLGATLKRALSALARTVKSRVMKS